MTITDVRIYTNDGKGVLSKLTYTPHQITIKPVNYVLYVYVIYTKSNVRLSVVLELKLL